MTDTWRKIVLSAATVIAVSMSYGSQPLTYVHGWYPNECETINSAGVYQVNKAGYTMTEAPTSDTRVIYCNFEGGGVSGAWIPDWVAAGGVLIASDTPEHPATGILPDLFPATEKCGDATWNGMAPSLAADAVAAAAPWWLVPGHYSNCAPEWEVLARCEHGEPVLILRQLSDGYLMLASSGGFMQVNAQKALNALIEQSVNKRNTSASGLTGTPLADGKHFQFQNTTATPMRVTGQVTAAGATLKSFDLNLQPGAVTEVDWSDWLPPCGWQQVTVTANGSNWTYSFEQPNAIVFLGGRYNLPEDLAARAPFRIFPDPARFPNGGEIIVRGTDGTQYPLTHVRGAYYTVDLTGIPVGTTELIAAIQSPGTTEWVESPPDHVRRLDGNPEKMVDGAGFFRLNGTRIFPLGFYHITWAAGVESREQLLNFCITNGYNLLHCCPTHDSDPEFAAFCDRAGAGGVMVAPEGFAGRFPAFAASPGLGFWNIVDEPDFVGHPRDVVLGRGRAIAELEPNHPRYMVLLFPPSFDTYFSAMDIVAAEPYPISEAPLEDIDAVYRTVKRLADQCAGLGIAPFSALQIHGGYIGLRSPTPDELRNMIAQALLAGSRGILFYAWQDKDFSIDSNPMLKEALRTLPQEWADEFQFVLNGTFTEITANNGLYAGKWTLPSGRSFYLAVNTRNAPATALLPAPFQQRQLDALETVSLIVP